MEKIVFVFNKFYTSLIKDIKQNTNESLKNTIRKHYKAINKVSDEYVKFFLQGGEFKEDDLERLVLKEISVKDVVDAIESDNDREVFWNYYYILAVLALVYKEYTEANDNTDDVDVLGKSVLDILTKKQKGDDVSDDISGILQDDIQVLIKKINRVEISGKQTKEPSGGDNAFTEMFKGMENSKICNLAQEISNDIDVSSIKADSPEDIMKLLDFSNSNNIMGDIIKKVSSKMHEKINNGELKQEDLFGEAMSMMGKMSSGGQGGMGGLGGLSSLFNNPMMTEMMKAAKKGKVQPKAADAFKSANTRERLRKKLEERRAK